MPSNAIKGEETGGLSVNADRFGVVQIISVYFDSRYKVSGALHTDDRVAGSERGVTEAQVRTVFGEPTRVNVSRGRNGEPDVHALVYSDRGVTFWIGDNPKLRGYNKVFSITVYKVR